MKSYVRRFASGLLVLSLTLGAAIGAPAKVGVLLKGKSAFWSSVEAGASEAAKANGAEIIVKSPNQESDVSIQVRLLGVLIDQGVQSIIIVPCNKDALAAPIAAAAAKGIKIVVMDSPLAGNSASTFIGTDHKAAGQAAGELLSKLVKEGDEVAIFKHNQGGGATEEREVGALEKLHAAYPNLVVHGDIYAGTEKDMEVERAKLLLSKHPKTKAIIASSTPGTMAMLKALEESHQEGQIKLVGFGFNLNPEVVQALEKGTLAGWIAQLPKEVGRDGMESALALIAGKTVAPVIHTDFVVVTKENLGDAKIQALLKL